MKRSLGVSEKMDKEEAASLLLFPIFRLFLPLFFIIIFFLGLFIVILTQNP